MARQRPGWCNRTSRQECRDWRGSSEPSSSAPRPTAVQVAVDPSAPDAWAASSCTNRRRKATWGPRAPVEIRDRRMPLPEGSGSPSGEGEQGWVEQPAAFPTRIPQLITDQARSRSNRGPCCWAGGQRFRGERRMTASRCRGCVCKREIVAALLQVEMHSRCMVVERRFARQLILQNTINGLWRKGWDSNPRYPCGHAGFQDRCLKPLGHPSGPGAVVVGRRGSGPPASGCDGVRCACLGWIAWRGQRLA